MKEEEEEGKPTASADEVLWAPALPRLSGWVDGGEAAATTSPAR